MAQLIVKPLSGELVARPLREGEVVTVGRGEKCDVRLTHPHVSEVHCQFAVVEGRWKVQDRHSSNGTFVDGVRVEGAHQLAAGAVVTLGAPGLVPAQLTFDGDPVVIIDLVAEVARLGEVVVEQERRLRRLELELAALKAR